MCALTPQPLVLLLLPKVQEQLSLLSISSSKNKGKTSERAAAGSQSFTRKAEQPLHGQQLMFSLGALGRTMLAVSANSIQNPGSGTGAVDAEGRECVCSCDSFQ